MENIQNELERKEKAIERIIAKSFKTLNKELDSIRVDILRDQLEDPDEK